MDPVDPDQLLDRELTNLPRPRAPHTLLPRVLSATTQRADADAPATGWSTWPRHWQLGSIAALIVLLVGAWMLSAAPPARVSEMTRSAGEAATLVRVLWQVMLQPVFTYIFVLGILLTLACAAAWAAMELALGGASHR